MLNDNTKQRLMFWIGLALLAVAAMGKTLQVPFLYEDSRLILENPATRTLPQAWQGLSLENLFHQPVLVFSYALDRAVGGEGAFGFHLVNLLIHIATGLLWYLVVAECVRRVKGLALKAEWRRLPLFAAALHLVHPLNVQAVAYLSDRGHLLAALFFVAGVFAVTRFDRWRERNPRHPRGPLWIAAGVILFFLACGAHASAVTLPLVAMGYLVLFSKDAALKKEMKISLAVLIPILLYLAWRIPLDDPRLADGGGLVAGGGAPPDRWHYLATQVKAWWFYYFLKYILPVNLNFAPDFALTGAGDPGLWAGLALTCAVAYLVGRRTTSPLVRFAWLWTAITLLPTSSLVPLDPVVSEARMYLPGMGLHLFAAYLLVRLTAPNARKAYVTAGILVAVLTSLSILRVAVFHSEETLWRDVLDKTPGQPLAAMQLASLYQDRGALDDAERTLRSALDARPDLETPRLKLGLLLMERKKYEQAVDQFEQAVHQGTRNPTAFYNLGLALVELGRGKDALRYLEQVIQGEKLPGKFYYLLGRAYHQAGQLEDALKQFRLAVKKDPNHAQAYNEMGEVYWDMKTYFFADAAFQKAYQVDNTSIPILYNLISSSMLMKQYDDAIRYCDRLLEVDPDNANARQWKIAAQRLKKTAKQEDAASPPGRIP